MTSHGSVAVLTSYSSITQLMNVHDALYQALGSGFTLLVTCGGDDARVLSELSPLLKPPLVPLVGYDAREVSKVLNGFSAPVLILPTVGIHLLLGVQAAVDLLARESSLSMVCGLTFDTTGSPGPAAYTRLVLDSEEYPVLVEVAQSDQTWKIAGRFAHTECVGPSRLAVLRSGSVEPTMCRPLSTAGMALANMMSDHGGRSARSVLFSGFAALTDVDENGDVPADDSVEILPLEAYDAWLAAGLSQVSVLHASFAVRDDSQRRIVHIGDRRVRAVDSRIVTKTADPGILLTSPAQARQLGPGFESMLRTLRGMLDSGQPREHWGSYEMRLIALAKRADAVLPHAWREYARRRLRGV